ncbi:MAG TPA: hypothetical protein EYG89_01480 [Bacteroidia bacterium]|nr:hypothetical protein [Bacteroidia bacterium]
MRKIKVELKRTGTNDFTAKASLKIKINSKVINNKTTDIISKALELDKKLFSLYDISYEFGRVTVHLLANSQNFKTFQLDIQEESIIKEKIDEVNEYFEKIKKFIKEIESWCEKNKAIKTTTKWVV